MISSTKTVFLEEVIIGILERLVEIDEDSMERDELATLVGRIRTVCLHGVEATSLDLGCT